MDLISKDGFKHRKYDVSVDVAGNRLFKYISPDRKLIIPVELVNGFYTNRYDRVNINEIDGSAYLASLLAGVV